MSRTFAVYRSDDGNDYVARISQEMADAGDFTSGPSLPPGTPPWPYNEFDMRHVCGHDLVTDKRVRIPISQPDQDTYVGGAVTIDYKGHTYQITSRIGEKRIASHIGG